MSILLLIGEMAVTSSLAELLSRDGWEILRAANLAEALGLLNTWSVDLCLIGLPGAMDWQKSPAHRQPLTPFPAEVLVAAPPEKLREAAQGLGLGLSLARPVPAEAPDLGRTTLEDTEKRLILQALDRHDWVQKKAAAELGISRRALNYKIAKFNLTHPSWPVNRPPDGKINT